jgi:SSS family solute:Na+ symporter
MLGSIIAIIVYLFVVTFLGYLGFKHTKTSTDYLIGGRQIHPMIMALSYGATFNQHLGNCWFWRKQPETLGMGLLWLTVLNICSDFHRFCGFWKTYPSHGTQPRCAHFSRVTG